MLEFRQAEASDARVIAELHAQSWRNTYRGILRDDYLDGDILGERVALWEQRLGSREAPQIALVAVDEGCPVGFAFVLAGADSTWGAMLDNLHVLPAAQGRGIGKQLLHRASVWVRDHFPGQGIFLWVFEANVHARDFYERLGASVVERTVVEPPGGGSLAEWRYAWPNIDDLCSATEV